jgi:type IV pilus assembly protein PilC
MNASVKKVVFFPFTILKYAGKGVSYLKSLIFNSDLALDPNRLEGSELLEELDKVKKQSADFKREAGKKEIDTNAKLQSFRYVVKNPMGEVIKGIFDAPDITGVRVFLSNEGYEIIEIKPRDKFDVDIQIGGGKISTGDLSFALIQLATYIKAGIPLIDSMRILAKQTTKPQLKRTYDKVIYELVVGETFSTALEKQGKAFPSILINMVKTSEMTGDLAGTLDEMADYFTQTEKTKKEMTSAMIYPVVILIMVVAVVFFLVIFIVPQFVDMFSSQGAALPAITVFVINASDFLGKWWWAVILVAVLIVIVFMWLYKHIREFRKTVQTLMMKFPVLDKIMIYGEVSTITRTFSSLLNHGVFITDCMDILSNLTNNEIYKEILARTMIGLSKGAKLSETFKGEWAFPVVAYEMIVTGESTGQLALMMQNVAEHFGNLHHNSITVIKSMLEPLVLIILAVCVGFLLCAIMLPMFDLYGQI